MRLVTYLSRGARRLGATVGDAIVDLPDAVGHPAFPATLESLVARNRGSTLDAARTVLRDPDVVKSFRVRRPQVVAPLALGRRGRLLAPGDPLPLPAEGELVCRPALACIVGREARGVDAEAAAGTIFGYTILVRWAGRRTDGAETAMATSTGPVVVTADELDPSHAILAVRVDGLASLSVDLGAVGARFADAVADASERGVEPGAAFLWPAPEHWGAGPRLTPAPRVGSVVEVEVRGLGALAHPIVEPAGKAAALPDRGPATGAA